MSNSDSSATINLKEEKRNSRIFFFGLYLFCNYEVRASFLFYLNVLTHKKISMYKYVMSNFVIVISFLIMATIIARDIVVITKSIQIHFYPSLSFSRYSMYAFIS